MLFCQVVDLSDDVIHLKNELERVTARELTEAEGSQPVAIDTNTMSEEEAKKLLMDMLMEQQFARALVYMRKLRYVG